MTDHYFKVTARAIVEMGRELISSDGIAFYELIKNGLDAGAPTVHIRFDLPVRSENWDRINAELLGAEVDDTSVREIGRLKNDFVRSLDASVTRSEELEADVRAAKTVSALRTLFRKANRIVVSDSGHGMTATDVTSVFLTLGTPMRRKERHEALKLSSGPLPLGEKGIGRLSAMRLGSMLNVRTATVKDARWNCLAIDWEDFERRSDEPLANIHVHPTQGEKKDKNAKGTELDIRGLRRAWTSNQVTEVLQEDIRRLSDPLSRRTQPIASVARNGTVMPLAPVVDWLLKTAHATIKADYSPHPVPALSYSFTYTLGNHQDEMHGKLGVAELAVYDEERIPETILQRIGAFSVEAYWWNRQKITKLDTLTSKVIRDAIREWAGGLSIYRDGFRVNPYGKPDNDWMGLDKLAFGSKGYKLNRQQLLGRVAISGRNNRFLVDQTNREGIQQSPEFVAFGLILQRLLLNDFKSFLERSEQSRTPRAESTDQAIRRLRDSVETVEKRLRRRIAGLSGPKRTWLKEEGLEVDIDAAMALCHEQLEKLREVRDKERATQRQLLPAAGMGLMLDTVVHELNRATTLAFESANNVLRAKDSSRRDQHLTQLRDELKTLRTRLSVLDDFAPSGRHRREHFDIVRWLADAVAYWEPRFREKGLTLRLVVEPPSTKHVDVLAVRGMFAQVVGNLLHNSLFWLGVGQNLGSTPSTSAVVTLDAANSTLRVSDDGPGIARADRSRVFELGFSRKGVGTGKGLGLFISAEIARYHKTRLRLVPDDRVAEDRLNTFEIDLAPLRK